MKRKIILLTALCAVSFFASAQVNKEVVVTKEYDPQETTAEKKSVGRSVIEISANSTPSVSLDNNVVSHEYVSPLVTTNFKPATATFWEHKKNYPFYLKLGAGVPLNTEGDLYATLHRAGVGYITGYINHYGLYSKIKYYNGMDHTKYKDNRSMQMNNRFGVAGGKYFGRYTLASELYYDMNLYHRFPFHNVYASDNTSELAYKHRRVDYGDLNLAVSFGDEFVDYSHLNFKVYATADYYHDRSETFVADARYQQVNVTAGAHLAREINKHHSLSLNLDYEGYYGLRSLKSYGNSLVGATIMYRYRSGGMLDLNVGAKVYYDNNPIDVNPNRWHGFPLINVSFNVGNKGVVVPYAEVDGRVSNNSYYSLVKENPYVAILGAGNGILQADNAMPNTETYNVRLGVSGNAVDNKLSYRGYFLMSFMNNSLYWYNVNQIFFDAVAAKRNVWALCGSLDYRPITDLFLTAQIKGLLYSNYAELDGVKLNGALPNVEFMFKAKYNYKAVTMGGSLELYGPTKWTWAQNNSLFNPEAANVTSYGWFKAPTSLNLSIFADWRINKICTLYAEGNNLLGNLLPTYRWAFYPELGASFTVGVKIVF